MTIKKALEKIITEHGEETYAEVFWSGSCIPRRLDLEYAIAVRDWYEVYGRRATPPKESPFPNRYRLSKPEDHSHYLTYNIYSTNKDGVLEINATIDVYPDFVYADQDWRETFHDTEYPRQGVPWWMVNKLLN